MSETGQAKARRARRRGIPLADFAVPRIQHIGAEVGNI
jgi:hypothetical protein